MKNSAVMPIRFPFLSCGICPLISEMQFSVYGDGVWLYGNFHFPLDKILKSLYYPYTMVINSEGATIPGVSPEFYCGWNFPEGELT